MHVKQPSTINANTRPNKIYGFNICILGIKYTIKKQIKNPIQAKQSLIYPNDSFILYTYNNV